MADSVCRKKQPVRDDRAVAAGLIVSREAAQRALESFRRLSRREQIRRQFADGSREYMKYLTDCYRLLAAR